MESQLSLADPCVDWITKLVARDRSYNDLSALLDFNNGSSRITASGTREIDYPPVLFHAGGEVEVYKSFSLPPDLVEKFAEMQRNCLMGIFPQCERAWVAIDNELFMWNYEDGEDLAYYDGIQDTIIAVGIAAPCYGVLPKSVAHLLLIATPLELVVLGMTYSSLGADTVLSRDSALLQVIPDPIYCISTDNYSICSIEATDQGRIFLGTKDGFLLEFCYGRVPGWDVESTLLTLSGARGPCSLVNHSASALSLMLPSILTASFRSADPIVQIANDAVRSLVYTRTEESNLSVFSYPVRSDRLTSSTGTIPSPASLTRLASVSRGEITSAASSVVRSVDRCQFSNLVSIIPLSSGPHHLMAITRTGIRLYFDERLRLLHVRLPPTSPYGTVGLSDVKLVAETRGSVVMVCTLPQPATPTTQMANSSTWSRQHQDSRLPTSPLMTATDSQQASLPANTAPSVIYTLSPDPFPWTPNLTEVCTSSWCVSGAWALQVLPSASFGGEAEATEESRLLVEDDAVLRQKQLTGHSPGATPSLTPAFPVGDPSEKQAATRSAKGQAPVMLTQHLEPPYRRLLLISAQGLVHLRLPNPLYRLKEFIGGKRQVNLNTSRIPAHDANATSLMNTPRRQFSSNNLGEFSPAPGDQPSFAMLDNNRFLTSYLHQFSPDEAICASLTVGADSVVWHSGLKAPSEIESAVEQVILFFAAEAAENWVPAVKCWSDCVGSMGQSFLTGSVPNTPSLQKLTAASPMEKSATCNSSIFLFTGLCVFVARMSRAFWRAPLFRDGSRELAKLSGGSPAPEKGIGSWVRSFVSVLASATTATTASPLQFKDEGGSARGSTPLISRFESHELVWLWHQLAFAQRFLRRHLRSPGGWFHADHGQTFLAAQSGAQASEGGLAAAGASVAVRLHRLAEETDGLLSLMLELLGFWRILSEHGLDVHCIVKRLKGDQCQLLLHLPFESYLSELYTSGTGEDHATDVYQTQKPGQVGGLVSPAPPSTAPSPGGDKTRRVGLDLLTSLINALIDHYLSRQEEEEQQHRQLIATGDATGPTLPFADGTSPPGKTLASSSSSSLASITARLLDACPTLFAHEDAISAKASEYLFRVGLLRAYLTTSGSQPDTISGLGSDEEEAILDEIDRLASKSVQLYTEAGPGLNLSTAVHRLISTGVWRGAVALCLHMAVLRDPGDIAIDCLKYGRRPSAEKPAVLTDGAGQDFKTSSAAKTGVRPHHFFSELAATEGRYAAYYQMVVCLEQLWEFCQMPPTGETLSTGDLDQVSLLSPGHSGTTVSRRPVEAYLSPASARSLLQTIIHEVVIASNDILAHFEVINWLLAHGLAETAVNLNSPHMEAYLRSRLRQVPDDPDLRCLLWRQLERRGARVEAAKVLEHLAVTPCSRLTLEDRLNFAARAIVVVKSLPASQQDTDYLHDMESRLELAQLQQQLYNELSLRLASVDGPGSPRCSSPAGRHQLEEAVHQLGHGPLLGPTEMFTHYADKFDLHESKLYLLWASGSQDFALIKAVWRDLLQSILSSSPASQSRSRSPTFSPRSPLSTRNDQLSSPHGVARRVSSNHRLVELALVDCLSRLGHRFWPDVTMITPSSQAQMFFPLSEIVATLERHAIQQSLPASWVPIILRDTRLSCCTAFISDAYDALLHSKETLWRLPEVHTRLLTAFVTVAEEFLPTVADQLPPRIRVAQTGRLLDHVTGVLVDLNSSAPTAVIHDVEDDTGAGEAEEVWKRQRTPKKLPTAVDNKSSSMPLLVTRLRRVHDQLKRYC